MSCFVGDLCSLITLFQYMKCQNTICRFLVMDKFNLTRRLSDMKCSVMIWRSCSSTDRDQLGVHCTSVLSHTWTKHTYCRELHMSEVRWNILLNKLFRWWTIVKYCCVSISMITCLRSSTQAVFWALCHMIWLFSILNSEQMKSLDLTYMHLNCSFTALAIAEMNDQTEMVNYIKGKSYFTQTQVCIYRNILCR